MIVNDSKSPQALVYRVGAGVLLTVIGFGISALPWDRIDFHGHMLWFTSHRKPVLLAALAVSWMMGFTISWRAESSLRDGVKSGFWPEVQLEALRRRIPAAGYLSVTALLAVLTSVALGFTSTFWHAHAMFWTVMIPIQTMTRISSILRNPQPVRPEVGLGLWNARPIHSQEWGRKVH